MWRKFLILLGLEFHSLSCSASNQLLYQLRYSGSCILQKLCKKWLMLEIVIITKKI
jgi:hypothetical protein